MSYFNFNSSASTTSPLLLVFVFLGAFVLFLLQSFREDGGLVENSLEVAESLGGRNTSRLVDCWSRERKSISKGILVEIWQRAVR